MPQQRAGAVTGREFDTLVIGLGAGAPLGMWIGYKLRCAIERARAVRETRVAARRASKHTPFGGLSETFQSRHHEQKARTVMKRPQFIPLAVPAAGNGPTDNERARNGEFQKFDDLDKERAAELLGRQSRSGTEAVMSALDNLRSAAAAKEQRAEVVAALVSAGYKKVAAVVAVDACTLAERASGVESWVVAAFRHALK
jgi:hypothetical protein